MIDPSSPELLSELDEVRAFNGARPAPPLPSVARLVVERLITSVILTEIGLALFYGIWKLVQP